MGTPLVSRGERLSVPYGDFISKLYIGSRDDAKNLQALQANRIRYVLNCTPSKNDGGVANFHEARRDAFEYFRCPLQDNPSQSLKGHLDDAFAFLHKARIREDGNVLIHCNKGESRSVAIAIAFLMTQSNMSYDDALGLVRKARPQAKVNDAFVPQLQQLAQDSGAENGVASQSGDRDGQKVTSEPEPKRRRIGPTMPTGRTIGPTMPPQRAADKKDEAQGEESRPAPGAFAGPPEAPPDRAAADGGEERADEGGEGGQEGASTEEPGAVRVGI
mmetsp:Transcript_12571/g.36490  ORF Transcript_12571/g.36490 Transcript_12571/m.36490 type:complete len:274 (-) Transcript_12571:137-958(-)